MRYLSCLFFLLFGSSFSIIDAQSFVTTGNSWYTWEWDKFIIFGPNPYNHTFRITGDTLIGNITYKKMFKDSIVAFAVREDSVGNVRMLDFVYSHFGQGPNKDFMVFKFDAKVGDSLIYWRKHAPPVDSLMIRYRVVSVDTLEWYGRRRKLIEVISTDIFVSYGGDAWIEGVGSTINPPFKFAQQTENNSYGLLCFNGKSINNSPCLISSHEPPNLPALSVRPNPASDYITFSAVQDQQVVLLTAVRLYDLTGRLVSTTAYKDSGGQPEIRISVADIANGMYLAVCRAGEQVVQQRVVVWKE